MDEETSRAWLLRTIALLLSLADLAEQSSLRSWFVRSRVLAILRPVEEVAYRSLAGVACTFGAPVPANAIVAAREWMAAADEGDDSADAMRLAMRFRALAVALACLIMQAGWLASRNSFAIGEDPAPGAARAAVQRFTVGATAQGLRTLKPPGPG